PPLDQYRPTSPPPVSDNTGPGSVIFNVSANGAQAIPSSSVPFSATARFSFNEATRDLGYTVLVSGASADQILGIYLNRRAASQNGPVAYILSKGGSIQVTGKVNLLDTQIADLKAGNFYLMIPSRSDTRQTIRGDLRLPSTQAAPVTGTSGVITP